MVSAQEKKKKVFSSFEVEIEMPQGVTSVYESEVLTVKGPKGEVKKHFRFPNVYVKVENNKVLVGSERFTKNEKKIIFTYRAHVNNLFKGVTEGFKYSLKVLYAKFPINVALSGNTFTVKNFLGEKVPRILNINPQLNVKVVVKDKDITVTGINIESVGQVAASIEQLTRINHLDRRVVQDGIFITEKPNKRYD